MKANVFLATALTVLSSAVLASGPSTFNQTQSVAAGVSGSVLVGTGSYTSNSTSVAGANAGSTVTPAGSTGTATAYHDSTSTASGWGSNGGAFAAGGGIGAAGSFGGTGNTSENANALSGGVTATIVLGANHYTATGANDSGIANAGAAGMTGSGWSGTIAGSNHYNTSTVWGHRSGRIAVRIGRQSGQLQCDRRQSLIRVLGGPVSQRRWSLSSRCCHRKELA
nr:hypothetical protein [Burkholderia ambifaria]